MKWIKSVLIHKWFQIKYSSKSYKPQFFHQYYSKNALTITISIFIQIRAKIFLVSEVLANSIA